VEITIIV